MDANMILLNPRLLRTFLRMFIEVGACVWAFATQEQAALAAVCLLAAYHVGALSYRAVEQVRNRSITGREYIALPGLIIVGAGFWFSSSTIAAVGLVGFGFAINDSDLAASGPTVRIPKIVKIGAKFVGMIGAALAALNAAIYILLALSAAALLAWKMQKKEVYPTVDAATFWTRADLANIFHQSGYFAFCFSFWALVPGISAPLIALLFPIGWIAYWIMEMRLSAPSQPFRPLMLGFGHLAFAATLLVMAVVGAGFAAMMVGWLLTGLFGGSCYTMQHAPGGSPSRLSDDLGAALGLAPAAVAIWLTDATVSTLFLGAGYAVCAAVAAFALARYHDEREVTP